MANAAENVVVFLLKNLCHSLGYTVRIKNDGRPLPEISFMKKDEKVSAFSTNWYQKYSWLARSLSSSRLYCWPCPLFGKSEPWSKGGYSDPKNIDCLAGRIYMPTSDSSFWEKASIHPDEGLRIQTVRDNEKS
jgi:hypothetical protein